MRLATSILQIANTKLQSEERSPEYTVLHFVICILQFAVQSHDIMIMNCWSVKTYRITESRRNSALEEWVSFISRMTCSSAVPSRSKFFPLRLYRIGHG